MSTTTTQGARGDIFLRLKLLQKLAEVSDGYYTRGEELAKLMLENEKKLETSQVRNLENTAYSTDKVSDILDLVKKQTAKERWSVELGEKLLDELKECHNDARRVAQAIDPRDEDLPRRVHLLLCRELIKHLAAHFIYIYGSRPHGEERGGNR